MTASLGDILKLSKSLTASMRQRDASVESSRRLARQSLNRLEACLDASDENVKRPGEGNLNVLAQALPELIVNYPEYRQLYEENRRLYVVVAEQQLTLEMIMQKYRTKMAEVAESGRSRMITQRCLDRNDGVLGMDSCSSGSVFVLSYSPSVVIAAGNTSFCGRVAAGAMCCSTP